MNDPKPSPFPSRLDFALDLTERLCAAGCGTRLAGVPPGARCPACAAVAEAEAWRGEVAIATAEARASIPELYRGVSLGSSELRKLVGPDAIDEALRLGGRTAVIAAPSARGKTRLAVGILAAHLDRASIVSVPRRREHRDEEERRLRGAATSRYVRAYALGTAQPWSSESAFWGACELLVLDDLGLEPVSFASAVAEVLFVRSDARRQTIVTTSWSEELIGTRYGDGVARRLFHGHPGIRLG
jgi:hypothetical protein